MANSDKDYPYLIQLEQFGSPSQGFLTSTQYADKLPFVVKRIFWVQQVPAQHQRGGHAGYEMEEILICLRGRVEVQTHTKNELQNFVLNKSDVGLYVPAKCWLTLSSTEDAILLCLASTDFDEKDYIWDFAEFKRASGPDQ